MATTTEEMGVGSSTGTIAIRGAVALVVALVVNAVLLFAVLSSGAVQPFEPLAYGPVLFFSALGVVGATAVYWLAWRFTDRPNRNFAVVAAVVLLLSFVPDVTVATELPGATTAGVVVLMAMHVVVAAVCVGVLTRRESTGPLP